MVGVLITMPEFGTLWAPWVYIEPGHRAKALGLSMIRTMIKHWDHGRFHKIACHVRPENRLARLVFRRVGFAEVALLSKHAFGEDILLLERPLEKTAPGYDTGLSLTRGQRLKLALGRLSG
jgi:L-amino acid N-acyltransferase YncA